MDKKDRIIAELQQLVDVLTKRVAELEFQLAKARKDSSKSPSSDIVKPPKKKTDRRK